MKSKRLTPGDTDVGAAKKAVTTDPILGRQHGVTSTHGADTMGVKLVI